jgi:hypothetical protein
MGVLLSVGVGLAAREREAESVLLEVPEPVGVPLGEQLGVAVGEKEMLSELLALAPTVTDPVGEADTVLEVEALRVLEVEALRVVLGVSLPVPEPEGVAEGVLLADTEGVGVLVLELVPEPDGVLVGVVVEEKEVDQDVLAVLLALAPSDTEPVGVADTVLEALGVVLGVPLLLPVTEGVALADTLAVRLVLTVPLPDTEPVGLAESVMEGVAEPVGLPVAVPLELGGGEVEEVSIVAPLGLLLRLPVEEPLGLGGGKLEGVALGVPVALPGAGVNVPEAVREGDRVGDPVAVGEESTHWTALGRYVKPMGQRG